MLAGEKKLRVTKTKWFDIIYPERYELSATILYENADRVYDEVTAQYDLSPSFRMPVVITPAVDEFNAFWTAVPYNHIAIYDTGVSGASELAVFSETLLSTFRHELTHAVTYNMKDEVWLTASKVFGDCFVPGMLSVTTGMAEGATLTSESAAGEGRLNDEYAKHYVSRQKSKVSFHRIMMFLALLMFHQVAHLIILMVHFINGCRIIMEWRLMLSFGSE